MKAQEGEIGNFEAKQLGHQRKLMTATKEEAQGKSKLSSLMQAILKDDGNKEFHVKVKDLVAQHKLPPYVLNQEGVSKNHSTTQEFVQIST